MSAKRPVIYVDLGYTSATEFWTDNVLPAYYRYQEARDRQTALDVSVHLWHLHEWVWHENNYGQDTQGNVAYKAYLANLLAACPALAWVRDIANAGKHRGLGSPHPPVVQRAMQSPNLLTLDARPITLDGVPLSLGNTLEIELVDGSRRAVCDILLSVMVYWKAHFDMPTL